MDDIAICCMSGGYKNGGRTFSFSAIVVVGNEEGIIGWGLYAWCSESF